MDPKNMTPEQIRESNPELYASIVQSGEEAERTRIQDIDDLTPAGHEEMAVKAKADGTSAADYLKQVVKAQRERGEKHRDARRAETAAANAVAGGAAEDTAGARADEQAVEACAKEIAAFAKEQHEKTTGTMY